MTIAFHCPYCAAAVELPDEAAGTKGRCPRCAARIAIPQAVTPGSLPAEPCVSPAQAGTADGEAGGVVGAGFSLPVEPQASRVTRWPRGWTRRRAWGAWVVPIAFLLILMGVVGWLWWQMNGTRRLAGELSAVEVQEVELSPVVISRTEFALPAKVRDDLLDHLQSHPLPLTSALMRLQLRGSSEGLVVSVAPGTRSVWYRVDVRGHGRLAQFVDHESGPYRQRRREALATAATEFLTTYHRVIRQEAAREILTPFRDRLGLTALVRGVGWVVSAQVGPNNFPCVYEEADGTLYFLMPPGVKEFTLTSRIPSGQPGAFPGRFTVKVKPPPRRKTETKTASEAPAVAPTETEPAPAMPPDPESDQVRPQN